MSKQGARLAATFSKGYSSRCAAHSKDICYVLYEHDILDLCVIHAQGAMLNLSVTPPQSYAELVRQNFATSVVGP